ncbi:MAG TPA: cell division protein ZipA C-terminal FtsZ-binding domain-containing protein [Steroidobacteraceae bacterium]|nr:cell division protein ZipA C-terminal FtsZ-binding domain-containing protein [Steroidobacteraceae bacterium]
MMSELRWTLLIIGVLFIVALAWWERRRPRQASGSFERTSAREAVDGPPPRAKREPPLTLPEVHAGEPLGAHELPVIELEALDAATAVEAEEAEELETVEAETADDRGPEQAWAASPATEPLAATEAAPADAAPVLPREVLPELPALPPPLVDWPRDEERRILAVRLVAPLAERFAGRSLRQALAAEGFVLGQFAIFHKPDEERRAVLSAASLTRPGTFDMQTMDSQHYGGLSLFAVLPGPKSPPQAFEELVFTARNLNERLHGVLQDERGTPLTAARIAQLREQLSDGMAS